MSTEYEKIISWLNTMAEAKGGVVPLGESLKAARSTFHRALSGGPAPSADKVLSWLEQLGGTVVFPHQRTCEQAREVCFVQAHKVPAGQGQPPPETEDYLAVPLVEEVGAGPGLVPQGELLSWFLVWKHQKAVRYKRDLIAVQIGDRSTSMQPTLSPGDVVLVDRQDKNVEYPGHIMLVMDPDGCGKIKRVAVQYMKNLRDNRITYYSDNAACNPPEVYSWREDFYEDWEKVIVGRVIWAWSDVSSR